MNTLSQLDTTKNPKEDFYDYAVGGWLAANPMPASESRWGTFLRVREDNWLRLNDILEELSKRTDLAEGSHERMLASFYVSAIDPNKPEEVTVPYLQSWIDELDRVEDAAGLIAYMAKMQKYGWSVPWEHFIDVDDKNSEQYIFRFRQSGLGLPDRDYYFREGADMETIRSEYRIHIPRMAALMGWENTDRLVEDVLSIETVLAEASMTRTEAHDLEAIYNKFSLEALKELTPNIAWDAFFAAQNLSLPHEYIVDQPKFFAAVNELLASKSLDTWKNYLRWHVLRVASACMGERFEEARFLFYGKVLSGAEVIQPRWKRVVIMMHLSVGEPLGKLFVDKHFPPAAKERMEVLVNDLRVAFEQRINKTEWMEAETRQKAIAKLHASRVKIGYPNKWRDYSSLSVTPDNYLLNVLEARRFEVEKNFRKLGSPVDKEEWLMEPQDVNAYNWYNLNEIVFPAGILQPPFFDMQAGDAENYGAIGSVIGHEMTHGFDDHGGQFDINGNMISWRSERDIENFKARCAVLVDQANNFHVFPDLTLNGTTTLGENTSDIGGVEIALDALERRALSEGAAEGESEKFTPIQRFFLSMALYNAENQREQKLREQVLTDPHAPAKFRVNGVLKNVDRFYDAFGITPEDPMYIAPEKRAKIW